MIRRAWFSLREPLWLENYRLGAPLVLGPTGEFAVLLQHRWNNASVFVQLISKIDEAGTHGASSPHMIMAGYVARINQWNRFDQKWNKALRKDGLEYFHAKEHWRHPFMKKAIEIADSNLLFGFSVKLNEGDYKSFYRNDPQWGGKIQPDSMYGLCFRYCLSFVLFQALLEVPSRDFVLNFIVEDGHPNSGAPTEIVRLLKKKHISGISEYLGTAIPGDKKKIPGLQAADGVAHGSWVIEHKPAVNITSVTPHLSVAELKGRSALKAPIFRLELGEPNLRLLQNGYFSHVNFRRQLERRKNSSRPDFSDLSWEQSS